MVHHEVPERKYKYGRVANSNISRTKGSNTFKPESTGAGNDMPASHNKEMGAKGPMVVSMVMLKIVFFTYKYCLVNQSISLDKENHIIYQLSFENLFSASLVIPSAYSHCLCCKSISQVNKTLLLKQSKNLYYLCTE